MQIEVLPRKALQYETIYQAVISNNLTSIDGYKLDGEYKALFLTEVSPNNLDSDNDGISDSLEREWGSLPDSADSEGDSVGDGEEYVIGSNPFAKDSDEDGIDDLKDKNPTEESIDVAIFFSDNGGVKDDIWTLSLNGQSCKNQKGQSQSCSFNINANQKYQLRLRAEYDEEEPTTYEIQIPTELTILDDVPAKTSGTIDQGQSIVWNVMYQSCNSKINGPKVIYTDDNQKTFDLSCLAPASCDFSRFTLNNVAFSSDALNLAKLNPSNNSFEVLPKTTIEDEEEVEISAFYTCNKKPNSKVESQTKTKAKVKRRGKMRVQLQERNLGADFHYASFEFEEPPQDGNGVTTTQVISGLILLRANPAIKNSEQDAASIALAKAINWVKNRPPSGVIGQNSWSFYFNEQEVNKSKRFDIENIVGHNLKQ